MNEQSSQNDNSKTPEFSEQDLSNLASELKKESPNKNLLKEIAQSTNLTPEEIKQTFPNLEKEWKGDRVEPVKTATDQEKINAYDKLNVKELPTDWELQLARLKHLESELSNYVKVKEELKGWTDTFSEKKPSEVQGEIKQLEEKQTKTEEEAKEKITELEQKLTTANQEKTQTNQDLSAKIRELEGELKEWEQTFDNLQLIEAKEIWEGLKQRPDIPITENEFYDDYARRKSIGQNEAESKEIESLREQVREWKEEKEKLHQVVENYLENKRIQRYVSMRPVVTTRQAQEVIAELLEKAERELESYLKNSESIGTRNLDLDLIFWEEEKKNQPQQILDLIKKARVNLDYQGLFEEWNNARYDDFDGSLYILTKCLAVKDTES